MKRFVPLASGAAALVSILFATQLASAHSRPIRFDPAPGAVLSTAPAKVDGWFTSALRRDPNWTFMQVTDAQGNRVDSGDATLSSDRRQMTATLKTGLGPGKYVVSWRTFDDEDGAIFGDCYTFFVGQAAADAAVTDKTRLDGGSACKRIDLDSSGGTPTPSEVATATAPPVEGEEATAESGDSGGIPAWGLVLGIVAGLVTGGVGGRYLLSRP